MFHATPTTTKAKPVSRLRVISVVLAGVAAGPALAMTMKSLMSEMRDTTKQAKSLLGSSSFDLDQARTILANFAEQAQAGEGGFGGSGAKAQDLRRRFADMASVADAAQRSVKDKTKFRAAIVAIAENCRSCHDLYK